MNSELVSDMATLAALEVGLALLEERREAFGPVAGQRRPGIALGLESALFLERIVQRREDLVPDEGVGPRRTGGESLHELLRFRLELCSRHDEIDQADALRLARGEPAGQKSQLPGLGRAERPRRGASLAESGSASNASAMALRVPSCRGRK